MSKSTAQNRAYLGPNSTKMGRDDAEGSFILNSMFAYQSKGLRRHQTFSFPNKHFTSCGEVARVNRVEIDTATHGFSCLVASVPIDGLRL